MKKNKDIQNIVFDFGGVLLDIDYQRTYDALSQLLNVEFEMDNLPDDVLKALADFETGKINVETFIWNLQRLATKEVPIGQDIIKAWNAMLIGWDVAKFDFLLSLRQRYKVYLLSNTNELHLQWVIKDLKQNHGITDFDEIYFDKTYYSHLIGLKKPEKEIYEWVTNDLNLDKSRTIFIDDLIHNIEGAASIGWRTYHHNPKENLIDICDKVLNLI